jgi:hypothetical protein
MTDIMWCETCQLWISEFRVEHRHNIVWMLCGKCGEGLVLSVEDVLGKNPSRESRKTLAKLMWSAPACSQ